MPGPEERSFKVGTREFSRVQAAREALVDNGFIGHPAVRSLSDTVEFWNGTNYDRFWYDPTVPAWKEWNGGPLRTIQPDDSIWITVLPFNSAFTWTYPKPYIEPPNNSGLRERRIAGSFAVARGKGFRSSTPE